MGLGTPLLRALTWDLGRQEPSTGPHRPTQGRPLPEGPPLGLPPALPHQQAACFCKMGWGPGICPIDDNPAKKMERAVEKAAPWMLINPECEGEESPEQVRGCLCGSVCPGAPHGESQSPVCKGRLAHSLLT